MKALKQNELQVFDELEQKKMTRAQLKLYVQGEEKKESVDLTELNKEY